MSLTTRIKRSALFLLALMVVCIVMYPVSANYELVAGDKGEIESDQKDEDLLEEENLEEEDTLEEENSEDEDTSEDENLEDEDTSEDENLEDEDASEDENLEDEDASEDENLEEEDTSEDENIEEEDTSEDENIEEEDTSEDENSEEEDDSDISGNTIYTYYIKVNIATQVITVYKQDDQGAYTIPVRSLYCSTGSATPTSGVYSTSDQYRWHTLYGNVYGQYCTRITGHILFHSVPSWTKGDPGSVITKYYDQLGTVASAGCVRLTVIDAKWIYENCPSGTKVEFYYKQEENPLSIPELIKISGAEGDLVNWDPTDPDENNPWIAYFAELEE